MSPESIETLDTLAVAKRFAEIAQSLVLVGGIVRNSNGSLFIEGRDIYSFGHHYKIAHIAGPRRVLWNKRASTRTTNKQRGIVRHALLNAKCVVYEADLSAAEETSALPAAGLLHDAPRAIAV